MNKAINILLIVFILIAALAVGGFVYTVDETQQVVITQFGQLIGEPKTKSGLYFKLPWQHVNVFEKRLLSWDGDSNQMPTGDQRFIWVDITARWRIEDPLKFMQTVRSELGAQSRLDDILDASTRAIVSSQILIEAIRDSNRLIEEGKIKVDEEGSTDFGKMAREPIKTGREVIAKQILERSIPDIAAYGIELVDVRIKRINFVKEVREKVYNRMVEERERAAQRFRSEGQGRKSEIIGQTKKELEEIRSKAYRRSQELTGAADALAIKIYADAYNKDPEFYSFVKTLESYKKTINKETTLILSTENEFYEQLSNSHSSKSKKVFGSE